MRIGQYEVVDELGRGGMGVVYRALDPGSGRDVAIKVLTQGQDATPQQRQRFAREAQALLKVEHRNVVRQLDVGEHEGSPYLVLEYHAEGSLQAALGERGPLSPELVTRVGLQLASALEAIHAVGVLHRDLKPGNVLFTSSLSALITDFGLVKDLGRRAETLELTRKGSVLGTPGYWAPEQTAGEEAGPWTDVYGLGATLYAALTGQPPVSGESVVELLVATREQAPTPIRSLREDVPEALEAIVLRCLEKEPSARWGSATELREALRRFSMGEEPVSSARGGAEPEGLEASDRSKVALAGTAIVLLVLIALGVGVTFGTASTADAPPLKPAEAPPSVARAPLTAQGYCERGLAKAEKQDDRGAIADYDRAIELDPGLTEAFYLRGVAKHRMRDYPAAIVDFSLAIQTDPRYAKAYRGRGAALVAQGSRAQAAADFQKARELGGRSFGLAAAAEPRPSEGALRDAWELVESGLRKHEKKDVEGATADYTKAIELRPGYARAYYNRGVARVQLRDYDGAIADYTKAIETNPRHLGAYFNRGSAKAIWKRDFLGAIADFTKGIEIKPGFALSYFNRGLALKELGNHGDAAFNFRQSLELEPALEVGLDFDVRAYVKAHLRQRGGMGLVALQLETGLAKYGKRDYAGAIVDYDRVIAMAPRHFLAHLQRGAAKHHKGDYDGAIADHTKAIELDPRSANAYASRGASRYQKGDREGAAADYAKALELDPRSALTYVNRGAIKHEDGDLEGALADYEKALAIDPRSTHALNNCANAKYAKGDPDGAIADLTKAIELAPRDPRGYLNRAEIRRRLGKHAEAAVDFQAGLTLEPRFRTQTFDLSAYLKKHLKPVR